MIQLPLTLKMTTAQFVKTSVSVNNNNTPIQDYVHHGTIKSNLLLPKTFAKVYSGPVFQLFLKWRMGSLITQATQSIETLYEKLEKHTSSTEVKALEPLGMNKEDEV